MSPLPRMFGKAPPPPTVAERIAALAAAPAEQLIATALGDEEVDLRVAAIGLLPDCDPLRTLAGLAQPAGDAAAGAPAPLRHAAQARLAQLIDTGAVDFAAFCAGRELRPETLTIAALCSDPERARDALSRVHDPARLAGIVVESPSSRLRQLAAAAIEDPAQLSELLKQVRHKDKTVYRIIQQKCDVLTAVQRQAEEAAREASALCAALERHVTRPYDAIYTATLDVLTQRWLALATPPEAEVEARGRAALERCREVIAGHDRELARHAAEQLAQGEARAAQEHARQAAEQRAAEEAELRAQDLVAANAAREAEERALWERRAAEEQAQREIASLIRLARAALAAGNTRKAARFRQSIEETLATAAATPPLARSLQQLDDKLNELRQWKDYVAAPKRIELIEEMEALVGSEEEPGALAEHIRALQQEWRTINKGIASDASAETERFQHAHQAAFRPCQEHFAAQAAARRANLAARMRVLERLKAFEAGQQADQADRRLIVQVLREAPREWRGHSPVDRNAARAAENEFNRSMDRLRALLNAWYAVNEAEKQSLIEQARALSTAEDKTQATDGVKRLQARWKDTGPASREKAEPLWGEFRSLCDLVFRSREQAHAQYAAGLEAAKGHAVALCDLVEQAAAGPALDRAATNAKLAEWRGAFEAVGELPRADARALRERFERALATFSARLAQQDARDAEAAVSNLLAAGRHVGDYERAVLERAGAEACTSLRSAAEAFIAGVPRWPKGGLVAAKQALARAAGASGASGVDDAAREKALRLLCIRAEILSSTPTPAEDEALRREYQLKLLMAGMGQGSHADDRDWDALLHEWIGSGSAAPAIHEALERRFARNLAKRPAKGAAESPFQRHDGRDARADRQRGERPRFGDRGRPRSNGPR